ncbi:MAG: hypothetical protein JXA22_01870 [Candidatus Thermoplasmatota archaeon]|nr:hypothetical protein [Candidatus Thermoplasmatota archaeon]
MGGLKLDDVTRLRERERGLLIGICTSDFSALHDTVSILKDMHIPHTVMEPGSVWEAGMDCLLLENGIEPPSFTMRSPAVVPITSDPGITVDRGIAASFGRWRPKELVAGIDPGKRPGVAFIADGILISARRAVGLDDMVDMLFRARKAYEPRVLKVRVGDGDPAQGSLIIAEIMRRGPAVELVDESQTTRTKRYRDENAAVLIARTRGRPV